LGGRRLVSIYVLWGTDLARARFRPRPRTRPRPRRRCPFLDFEDEDEDEYEDDWAPLILRHKDEISYEVSDNGNAAPET
jgi:hypothetical protein